MARQQRQEPLINVPIGSIYEQRQLYHFPGFQRGYDRKDGERAPIWKKDKQGLFIDSILRGYTIPAFTLVQTTYNKRLAYDVIDGQQRLLSVLSFLNGEITTLTEKRLRQLDPTVGLEVIEPGLHFKKLSPELQDYLRVFTLPMVVSGERTEAEKASMFRRMQEGMKLATGETLHSYTGQSMAANYAYKLRNHPFWTEIYTGKDNHRQKFHMGLSVVYMAAFEWPTNIDSDTLRPLASGLLDNELPSDTERDALRNLDAATHLYHGTRFRAIADIIPIIQSLQLLEEEGYDLPGSQPGALTQWLSDTIRRGPEHTETGVAFYSKSTQLTARKDQEYFWSIQKPHLLAQPGLVKKPVSRFDASYFDATLR